MGYPYPYFRLCAFLGPYPKEKIMAECQDEREAAVAGWLPCSESKVVWISPALEELISDAIPSRSLLAIIAL